MRILRTTKLRGLAIISCTIFVLAFGVWFSFTQSENKTAQAAESDNYIQFDGRSYIDTGIDQRGDTDIEATFQVNGGTNLDTDNSIFGARCQNDAACNGGASVANAQSLMFYFSSHATNSVGDVFRFFTSNTQTATIYNITDDFAAKHTVQLLDKRLILDGVERVDASSQPSPTVALNLYLGAYNQNGVSSGSYLRGKIFSFQISKSGALVQNLLPINTCQTMSTTLANGSVVSATASAPGFYDTVTNTIFYNQGTGTLTYVGDDDGKCTVNFDSRGGSVVNPELIDYNTNLTEPTNPTRDGYDFAGWHTADLLNAPEYDFNTPVTSDLTLYAEWQPKAICEYDPNLYYDDTNCLPKCEYDPNLYYDDTNCLPKCEYDSTIFADDEGCIESIEPDNPAPGSTAPIIPSAPNTAIWYNG
jgi:uncharacterized repeat protein (TIGR02543 family)